jgi:dCTP deaminase
MILSDKDIAAAIANGDIEISHYKRSNLGCNSYDVHLGGELKCYVDKILDAKKENPTYSIEIPNEGIVLMPGELYLCYTVESVGSKKYVPIIEGKSSIGRLGVKVHLTAGFGDVGFIGHWTLEIEVTKPIRIYKGMPIAQIAFHECGEVEVPYNFKARAKYNSQPPEPVASKNHENFF